MPARPHRTVDRVTGILETVSLSPRGVTLAELANALDAAKSSVQELTNGLLARGYLVEEDGRFHLGPGPFILAARANKLAALSLTTGWWSSCSTLLGCNVLVGVRVGDAMVFTDYAGQESPGLTYVARTHARRPLYTSAAGKTLLANVPDDEMYRLLDLAGPSRRARCGSSSPSSPRSAPPARVQPRGHLRRRVRRGDAPVGTRRHVHRGDQRSRRPGRSGSSRRPRRGAQGGSRHARCPVCRVRGRPPDGMLDPKVSRSAANRAWTVDRVTPPPDVWRSPSRWPRR